MLFFINEKSSLFQFSLKFEQYNLDHTHIEVSFDGFAYRFPKTYLQEWLKFNGIKWLWACKKTEIWTDDLYDAFTINLHAKPPIIRFTSTDVAMLFKLTWDSK